MPTSFETRIASLTQPKWWFKMDSASAQTNSGNFGALVSGARSGPAAGAVLTTGGKSGDYVNFPYGNDGTNGRAYFSIDPENGSDNAAIFNHNQSWTFEFFFKTGGGYSNSSPFTIFYMGSSGSEYIRAQINAPYVGNPGKLIWQMSGTSTNINFASTSRLDDNAWHHVAFVHTANTGGVLYIDGTANHTQTYSAFGQQYKIFDRYSTLIIGAGNSASSDAFLGGIDDFLIYNYALTSTQVAGNYNSVNSTSITFTDTSGATASALAVQPTVTATTVINVSPSAAPATASAEAIQPQLSTEINIDGGGVSTASALAVDPSIATQKNINNAADPATASATSPESTVATQKFVNVSADPATSSALMSSNVFYGEAAQDDSYTLSMRQITTNAINYNTNASQSFSIGTQSSNYGDTIESRFALVVKPLTGYPAYNKIVKAKFDSTHMYTSGSDTSPSNTFNVYVLTGAPTSGTFTTAGYNDFTTNREFLYKTRTPDDGTNIWLDLTPAMADTRAHTYGVMVEHIATPHVSAGTVYDRTEYYANTGNLDNGKFLYTLTTDIVNKNINADIITASALFADSAIATQRYVSVDAQPSTASADIVNPGVGLSTTITAAPATASAEAVQPTFSRTVEFPHTFATAHSDIVNPTVFAFGQVTVAAAVSTASAELHMPQFGIGENNSVDHMNATALFVMPTLIIPESVDAMTTTASATMVQPTVTSQLLGAVTASPMTATTDIITPPSYVNLLTDKWYSTLFTQHSRLHGVRIPISNETGEAILKRFDDVVTPKLIGSTVVNYLSAKILTDIINGDSAIGSPMNVIGQFDPTANPASITPGFFDPYGRKAVRLNNITTGYENSLSFTPEFTFEMSIKTTKADQIIAFGRWAASYGNQRRATVLGISDGKLFVNSTQVIGVAPMSHYKELADSAKEYAVIGNKSIADDQWHHIVVQYGFGDGRVQFWIDGKLDIQRFTDRLEGLNFLGHNASVSTYASDFYTSVWSYDTNAFILEQDVSDHNFAYSNVEPIRAEPMIASATATSGNNGKGNRKRALMLYFWPTGVNQNNNLLTKSFVDNTFDQSLDTWDYIKEPPQQYYGWDVFPVDITGYFVSDLVKEQAYGGSRNIFEQTISIPFTGQTYSLPKFKVNRKGSFRNTLTDTARYINLTEDIDLSQFDAIFFKNYPDESVELESYARNEVVDSYFNLRETVIFENFLKSLRAAVDTGISLMVTNPQLALDLKIVDRIESVPDLRDTGFYYSDTYTPTIAPATYAIGTETTTSNLWSDTFRNNRTRLINTYPGITDQKCITYVRAAAWQNDDSLQYGGPNRTFNGYEIKPNGLSVGDEWYFSTFDPLDDMNGYQNSLSTYLATPLANVKAGTPITAFANQYRQGLNLVDNPYKNYVTSIAIKPGDVLDGKQVGGKIWVNFTDYINLENEYIGVDAIHPDFINLAYEEGTITLAERNAYLANPDIQASPVGELTANTANKGPFWQSNGDFVLTQGNILENQDGRSDFSGDSLRKGTTRKTNKAGITSAASTSFGGQFFTFTYARKYPILVFENLSMNTRGFRWIGDRAASVGQAQTHTATIANATMVQPVVTPGKQVTVIAQAMLSNAEKVSAVGFAGANRVVITLPLEASARITEPSKVVIAAPMTSSVLFSPDYAINTTATDQVVLYVLHEDPILYLREDIIK